MLFASPSSTRAHPRSRGENLAHVQRYADNLGSSPLTRGKHVGETQVQDRLGLIPAHAGKTPPCSSRPRTFRAHPRSRGENTEAAALIFGTTGSSPLTRGKRRVHGVTERLVGLIPTHAGKTGSRSCRLRPSTAHPRSRGENAAGARSGRAPRGSSPLTRGKHGLNVVT